MMFIKEKSPSAPALLAAEVVKIATKTLKQGYCRLFTTQFDANKYLLTLKKEYNFAFESFLTNINKAWRLEQ